jgi:hypothetical protein
MKMRGGQQQQPGQPDGQPDMSAALNDAANYDGNGNYVGPGAFDDQGNWIDVNQTGWQGGSPVGVPDFSSEMPDASVIDPSIDTSMDVGE